jgi:hypothetical protein
MKKLYEILVPTARNDGRPISARYHRIWDENIIKISGGLTILSPAKGTWVSPSNEIFKERMIPVRILCEEEDILSIIDYTIDYYEQEAVLAYVISDNVILKHAENSNSKIRNPTKEELDKLRMKNDS